MGKTWDETTDWFDVGGTADERHDAPGRSRRRADDRAASGDDAVGRRSVRRRRLAAVGVIVAVAVALAAVATSLAQRDDDFVGVWWEPASGRRVEIAHDGDGYTLLYGAQRRPFAAELRGDELVIAAPLGGDIVVRAVAADRLELEDAGRTTTLQPAPDGS